MTHTKLLARTAGAVYLLLALLGGWVQLAVRAAIHVPGDAAASADNLAADPTLFRVALGADIAMAAAFVLVGLLLFRLFRHVDRQTAGLLVVFVAIGAGIILTNLLVHQAAWLLATDATYDLLRSDALVPLLLDLHGYGYALAGVFFGLWLLPLSYLGYRSGFFPRVLSALLAVAGVSWMLDTLATFVFPDLPAAAHSILTAPTIAEFWLIAYLLVRGVRTPAVDDQRPAPASSPRRAT